MVDLTQDRQPNIKPENLPSKFELCKEGDVAFADASEDTNEVAKVVEFYSLKGKSVVCGLHTIHGRDAMNKTIVGFKGYAFSSQSFHYQVRRLAQGTKVFSVSTRNFSECSIGLPSKAEQAKIANLFRLLDTRIATQSKLIEDYDTLIKGIVIDLQRRGEANGTWRKVPLADVLTERSELNSDLHTVHSVSVSQGVINQVDYLGRSFAAKDTSKYHVSHYGDIIYTKSPTGSFPYGIIKQNRVRDKVAVSPLYGVYMPANYSVGVYLHEYFMSEINAYNYLHPLIQKGAKNTINITNQRFLENNVLLPTNMKEIQIIADILSKMNEKRYLLNLTLQQYKQQKQYLLRQMFI